MYKAQKVHDANSLGYNCFSPHFLPKKSYRCVSIEIGDERSNTLAFYRSELFGVPSFASGHH